MFECLPPVLALAAGIDLPLAPAMTLSAADKVQPVTPKSQNPLLSVSLAFRQTAQEISDLIKKGNTFLERNYRDYVNVNAFASHSAMTDDQRDLIERETVQFIRLATSRIEALEQSIGTQKFPFKLTQARIASTLTDLFSHQKNVVHTLYQQLQVFSQRYNQARRLRAEGVSQQRAFFELSSAHVRHRPAQLLAPATPGTPSATTTPATPTGPVMAGPPATGMTPMSPLTPVGASVPMAHVPQGEGELLEQENADLTRELTDVFFRAKQVENTSLEIARLDEYLQQQMERQDIQIQDIIQNLLSSNQNVDDAHSQLVQARRGTSMRRVLAYMMFILGCLLLFYNWLY
ncbi:hypothetical protein PAPYR_8581 [Paratrimastix pyriformis]|uniref:Syntaxin 18 n=1 Tax=Paratrimastix pyriformis TaxID=342808 RepID=A0ABQ8UAE3_9EUKA|nr:hypothetical protein PAPYR_8581 [Paratrimastix pyriformis]